MNKKFKQYKTLNIKNITDEIAQYWSDHQIFEKSVSSREGKQAFVFYDGPPSANGKPGIPSCNFPCH